ncbi:MAG TPA: transglycosylase domain-containing protein [Cyclobacteriaceae bacterium]|jgi:penicillin-binding protein 1A
MKATNQNSVSEKNIWRRIIFAAWTIAFLLLVVVPFYFYSVAIDLGGFYGGMPGLQALENPENDLSSELLTSDGVSLGKYFRYNRSQVTYEQLSQNLINALIAKEDIRFENHSGVDLWAFLRAVAFLGSRGGGSTITQQLAKKIYNTMGEEMEGSVRKFGYYPRRIVAKSKEWLIAIQLEKTFTKEEILALYLNTVPFGSLAFGIKAASETFFNKTPDSLSINEAALLIGLLESPSRNNPRYHPEMAKARRNVVLVQMVKYGYISQEQFDTLSVQDIVLDYRVASHKEGLAPYFRNVILFDLLDFCRERGIDLYESGLKIYTTIDSRLQLYAEEAVTEHMDTLQRIFNEHWEGKNPWIDRDGREIKGFIQDVAKRTERYRRLVEKYGEGNDSIRIIMNTPREMTVFSYRGDIDTLLSPLDSIRYYKRFLHAGFMAMDPFTGHIKAWVGGINYNYFQYDHVRQGKNQPGSTFKPIVYTSAIENGYYPCYQAEDVPKTYVIPGNKEPYRPKNAENKWSGQTLTLRNGMAQSKNSITVHITNEIGAESVVNAAHRLGITGNMEPVLSIGLGTHDVSVYELVGAYATFVNRGTWTKPFYISRIEDKYGNVLQNFVPTRREAISEETAYLMLHMLKGTIQEPGGTGRRLDYKYHLLDDGNEIGAKTGTTQNYSDGWFMGVTKDLAAGAWVGGDDRSIHFRNIEYGQGAVMALPIWALFMQKVYSNQDLPYTKGPFPRPTFSLNVELDCSKYGAPGQRDSIDFQKPLEDIRD